MATRQTLKSENIVRRIVQAFRPTIVALTVLVTVLACGRPITMVPPAKEERALAARYLRTQDVSVVFGAGMALEISGDKKSRDALLKLRAFLRLRLDTIRENLVNCRTSRNVQGDGPYNRRYADFDERGNTVIRMDKKPPLRLKYDPTHPDALKVGSREGYVVLPGFDVEKEARNYFRVLALREIIFRALKKIDPGLLMEKGDEHGNAEIRRLLGECRKR